MALKKPYGPATKGEGMSNLKDKKGSITVEAALVLPIFICAVLTIGFLIKVYYVQEIFQQAITEAANEISSYSYVYYASGLYDIQEDIDSGLQEKAKEAEGLIAETEDFYNNLLETKESVVRTKASLEGSISEFKQHMTQRAFSQGMDRIFATIDEVKYTKSQVEALLEKLNALTEKGLDNPQEKLKSFAALMGSEAWRNGKAFLGGMLTQQLMEKHLVTLEDNSISSRLLKLNVIDGIEGLDLSESSFFEGNEDIHIVLKYKIKIPLPIDVVKAIPIRQEATARGWLGGDFPSDMASQVRTSKLPHELVDEVVEAGYDIWALKTFDRGRGIKRLLGTNIDEDFPIIDKLENNTITSIRTHDTRLKSNQGSSFMLQLKEDLRRIADYVERSFRGFNIGPEDYSSKELNLVFPDVEITEEQIACLYDIRKLAADKGIRVKITVVI